MIRPRRPKDETRRLATLRHGPAGNGALGPTLDELTRAARELFQTGLGALGVVDGPLVTGDAHVRFHASCPVSTRDGGHEGALCVLGQEPRVVGASELDALRELGRTLEREIQSFEAASFDTLTGLTNRAGLLALGEEMLSISRSADEGAAVLFVGVDGLAALNRRLGHEAGDRALQDLARILEGNVRGSDLVARVGGDEFCAVLTPYSAETESIPAAVRVEQAVERYNETAGVPWALQVTLGGARYRPGMALDGLLSLADTRMTEARALRLAQRH